MAHQQPFAVAQEAGSVVQRENSPDRNPQRHMALAAMQTFVAAGVLDVVAVAASIAAVVVAVEGFGVAVAVEGLVAVELAVVEPVVGGLDSDSVASLEADLAEDMAGFATRQPVAVAVKWASVAAVPERKLAGKVAAVVVVKAVSYNFGFVACLAAKVVGHCYLHSSSWRCLHLTPSMAVPARDIAGSTSGVVTVVRKDVGKAY